MTQKLDWLPINESLIPHLFSFRYPQSRFVRWALITEIVLATLAVIGTLVLTLLPPASLKPNINTQQETVNP